MRKALFTRGLYVWRKLLLQMDATVAYRFEPRIGDGNTDEVVPRSIRHGAVKVVAQDLRDFSRCPPNRTFERPYQELHQKGDREQNQAK
jgi:hypothetical protein